MKTKTIILTLLLTKGLGMAQSFVNLNFESATFHVDPNGAYPPYSVYASNAIPGWTAYISGAPQADILFNDALLSLAFVSIQPSNSVTGYPVLQGNYSILFAGQYNPTGAPGATNSAALGQFGQIPLTAQSMTFYGYNLVNMQVTFNGQLLSFLDISNALTYSVYSINISAYAGQTGELLFTTPYNGGAEIDNIQFSSLPIPEPCVMDLLGLGGLGGLLLMWRRWRQTP